MIEEWIDMMVKDIKKDNPKPESNADVQLSESQMNELADLMIKKMSNPSCVDETREDNATKNEPQEESEE